MNTAEHLVNPTLSSVLESPLLRRKRLGQYFTGPRLAKLLAALAEGQNHQRTIDPMAGTGDMLVAAHALAPDSQLFGIEIDSNVAALATSSLGAHGVDRRCVSVGNAFDWETLSQFVDLSFDLVITNPPYVRYQSLSNKHTGDDDLPSSQEIRQSLLNSLERMNHLIEEDRVVLQTLAQTYSGLSDLAVPSWLLSAALTQIGGDLAIVVPESWLSRDYARPIQYLLSKLFTLQYVVEDRHRAWFDTAQVKTMLIVARRISSADLLEGTSNGTSYLHIGLPESTIDNRSIVGRLFSDSKTPEIDFVRQLQFQEAPEFPRKHGVSVVRRDPTDLLGEVADASFTTGWFTKLEPLMASRHCLLEMENSGSTTKFPAELTERIPQLKTIPALSLATLGVEVGQGLRTGANSFFYVTIQDVEGESSIVSVNKGIGGGNFRVPTSALQPVLRRQDDMPDGFVVEREKLQGRVLDLSSFVRLKEAGDTELKSRRVMDPELERLVTLAENTNLGTSEVPKFIPQLSAVRTNAAGQGSTVRSSERRFWYMLPPFAQRHLPDLFVARVISKLPRFVINSDQKVIIDANFSTLWLSPTSRVNARSLLALLNSTWSLASLASISAVMGGGAMKIEAAHIKRLSLPQIPAVTWDKMEELGTRLIEGSPLMDTRQEIDRTIAEAFLSRPDARLLTENLCQFVDTKLKDRLVRV